MLYLPNTTDSLVIVLLNEHSLQQQPQITSLPNKSTVEGGYGREAVDCIVFW